MIRQLNLIGPPKPMRRPSAERRRVVPSSAYLRALESYSRVVARSEAVGVLLEPRARPTPRGSLATRCEYCRPGSGYHVPAGGCPCTKSSRDTYEQRCAETRAALLRGEIPLEYTNGRIIGIR